MLPGSDIGGELPAQGLTFPTTHWTVVLAAGSQEEGTRAREAMAALCSTYWYPLYAFVRRRGLSPPDAEDVTQEFFRRLLEGEWLRHVAPARGKFRSFLLACLKHLLAKERERGRAARRGGGRLPISLDAAETQYGLEPADSVTPEVLFDRHWAATVLALTLEDLRQEHAGSSREDWFEDLVGFLPGSPLTVSRADLAAKRQVSAGAVDVAIYRLRQRYGVLLRRRVAQTVSTESEVDEELRYLMSVVGGGP